MKRTKEPEGERDRQTKKALTQYLNLLHQSPQGGDSMGVQQALLVDGVTLQEVLQHQQERGNQVLLQTRL
jgi:hypothetical protein